LRFRLSLSLVVLIAALTAVSAFAAAPAAPKVTYSGKTVKAVFTKVVVAPKAKCTWAEVSSPTGYLTSPRISGFKQVGNKVSFKATFTVGDKFNPVRGTYVGIVQCFVGKAFKNAQVPFLVNAK
jgi:hypothetical protein